MPRKASTYQHCKNQNYKCLRSQANQLKDKSMLVGLEARRAGAQSEGRSTRSLFKIQTCSVQAPSPLEESWIWRHL